MKLLDLSRRLAFLAIFIDLTVSGNLLTYMGSAYISDGGSIIEKIHPGSYLALASGLLRILIDAYSSAGLRRSFWRHKHITIFLAGMMFCIVYALCFTGTGGLIALIDTFLPAGMLAYALCDIQPDAIISLRRLLQWLFVLNACTALVEVATGSHLVPTIIADSSGTGTEYRPTALYDHPLTGATATMLGLLLVPDGRRATILNMSYFGLLTSALLAFGERAPLILAVSIMASFMANASYNITLARAFRMRHAASIVGVAAIVLALLPVAMTGGIGQRLIAHMYWDSSAQVRLQEFQILPLLTGPELIFGCTREDLIALIEPLRLSYSVGVIENFWLVMLLTLGCLGFPVFVGSLCALLWWLWRSSNAYGRLMVLALLLTASGSNSLGRKSMLLVLLVACVAATRESLDLVQRPVCGARALGMVS